MSEKNKKTSRKKSALGYFSVSVPSKKAVFEAYDRIRQFYIIQQVVSCFDKRLDDPAPLLGKRVLDVGCGLSRVGEFLVLSGADVTSLDLDESIIQDAKQIAQKYGTDITFIQGRIEDFIHAKGEYDVVLCLDILEYIADPQKFLWVLEKILEDNGVVIVSAISRNFWSWLIHVFISAYVLRRTPRGSRKYAYFYTPEQLGNLLSKVGLELVHQQGMDFSLPDEQWQLSKNIKTRYLATIRKKEMR